MLFLKLNYFLVQLNHRTVSIDFQCIIYNIYNIYKLIKMQAYEFKLSVA